MDQHAQYLIQILEKIGSPLMASIIDVAGRSPGASQESDQEDARKMAELLGKSIQMSISLGQAMDMNTIQAGGEALRVALAGLSGPLIAGQFKHHGRIPEESDLKRLTTALQAVLTFSENFAPDVETISRLEDIRAKGQPVDAQQSHIQYIYAFLPVVSAVGAFSFGQPEQKLIIDVANQLVKRAVELREILLSTLAEEDQKRAELGLLSALGQVYSACHMAEMTRVMALSEGDQAGSLSLDPVWKSFDLRVAMLETLARNIVPGGAGKAGGSGAPQPERVDIVSETAAEIPQSAPQAVESPHPIPEEQLAPPPAAPVSPPSGSPMAMFAKPKDGGETIPPTAAPSSAQPPPSAPPETQDVGPGSEERAGGPMSFFKKKDES